MTISEPATLVTDYLLAAFTAVLAWRLSVASREANGHLGASQRWWAMAFGSTAVAGVAGGTVHGFQLMLDPGVTAVLWLVTLESLVLASYAVVRAALLGSGVTDAARRSLSSAAAFGFLAWGAWVVARPVFLSAIAAYGAALAALVLVHVRGARRSRKARLMLAGAAISVAAAAVQQSGWSLHRYFNHNDLYHVIQAAAVWLLYLGARRR